MTDAELELQKECDKFYHNFVDCIINWHKRHSITQKNVSREQIIEIFKKHRLQSVDIPLVEKSCVDFAIGDIYNLINGQEKEPEWPKWCDHAEWVFCKGSYRWCMTQVNVATDKHDSVPVDWKFCPICAAPRSPQEKME